MRVSLRTMRGAIVAIVVAGCSFAPQVGGGDDTPGEDTVTITHDTAADFADPAELIDGVLTPDGRIEPNAYVMGGLHARSFVGRHVDTNATFATLDAAIANLTPRGRSYAVVPADWQSDSPAGLSIPTTNDDFTIYFDGEIHLRGGMRALRIDADDVAILEVVIAGTPHLAVDASGREQIDVLVPADGWYPIRLGYTEGNGSASFSLRVDGNLDPLQLRSRVTDERGLIGQLFEPAHVKPLGTAGVDGFDGSFAQVAPPFDFQAPQFNNYEFRVIGQIFIDVPGAWRFELAPDAKDTARLWIDEEHVASAWADGVTDGHTNTATIDLAVGWHDIFLDFRALQISPATNVLDPHDATIQVRAAPPGGTSGPIPLARLRPVVSSGLATAALQNNRQLTSDGVASIAIPLPPAATRIHSVDAGYAMAAGTPRASFTVELDTGGSLIPIPNATGLDAFGLLFDDVSLRDQPSPATPWAIKFTDITANSLGGTLGLAFVDIVTRGGPAMPFSPTVTYTSKPLAAPGAIKLGAVRVTGSFDDAEVQIAVRTAATEAELDAAEFVATDGIPDVEPGELIQYRLTATSDGWQFPVIDVVELDYVVAE